MDNKELDERLTTINEAAMKAVAEGDFEEAISLFTQRLELEEKHGMTVPMAESHTNIANIWFSVEEHDQALLHLEKAVELFQKAGRIDGVISVHLTASVIFELTGDAVTAQKSLEAALRIADTDKQQGVVRCRLAALHQRAERYDQAQEAYNLAVMEIERSDSPEDLMLCLMARASLYSETDRLSFAERDIARAKQLSLGSNRLTSIYLNAAEELGFNM